MYKISVWSHPSGLFGRKSLENFVARGEAHSIYPQKQSQNAPEATLNLAEGYHPYRNYSSCLMR